MVAQEEHELQGHRTARAGGVLPEGGIGQRSPSASVGRVERAAPRPGRVALERRSTDVVHGSIQDCPSKRRGVLAEGRVHDRDEPGADRATLPQLRTRVVGRVAGEGGARHGHRIGVDCATQPFLCHELALEPVGGIADQGGVRQRHPLRGEGAPERSGVVAGDDPLGVDLRRGDRAAGRRAGGQPVAQGEIPQLDDPARSRDEAERRGAGVGAPGDGGVVRRVTTQAQPRLNRVRGRVRHDDAGVEHVRPGAQVDRVPRSDTSHDIVQPCLVRVEATRGDVRQGGLHDPIPDIPGGGGPGRGRCDAGRRDAGRCHDDPGEGCAQPAAQPHPWAIPAFAARRADAVPTHSRGVSTRRLRGPAESATRPTHPPRPPGEALRHG